LYSARFLVNGEKSEASEVVLLASGGKLGVENDRLMSGTLDTKLLPQGSSSYCEANIEEVVIVFPKNELEAVSKKELESGSSSSWSIVIKLEKGKIKIKK
jgi:hypothetical protein